MVRACFEEVNTPKTDKFYAPSLCDPREQAYGVIGMEEVGVGPAPSGPGYYYPNAGWAF